MQIQNICMIWWQYSHTIQYVKLLKLTCYGLRAVHSLEIDKGHFDTSSWDSQEGPLQFFPCKWTEWSVPWAKLSSLPQFGHMMFPNTFGGKRLAVLGSSYILKSQSAQPSHLHIMQILLHVIKSTLIRVCNLHSSSVDGVFHEWRSSWLPRVVCAVKVAAIQTSSTALVVP